MPSKQGIAISVNSKTVRLFYTTVSLDSFNDSPVISCYLVNRQWSCLAAEHGSEVFLSWVHQWKTNIHAFVKFACWTETISWPNPIKKKNILPCYGYSLEHLLDSCGIASKCHGHLQSLWWDVAHGCLDVVGDPFNEVGWVLVLNVKHLFVHFLGRHTSTEESRSGQVATMARISCAHHVLGIEHPCRKWGLEEMNSLIDI